jgi:predicted DCC family thiol-disulfide oxidoreductase YuxK
MEERCILLFDGDCAFCNGWVKWISARDEHGRFAFEPLRSEEGQQLMKIHSLPEQLDSVVLIAEGKALVKSDAAIAILHRLPGKRWLGMALSWLPRPVRDAGYDLIARNRHRLGLKDTCELPHT